MASSIAAARIGIAPRLVGRAQQDHVGGQVVAEERLSEPERVDEDVLVLPGHAVDRGEKTPRVGECDIGRGDHRARRDLGGRHDGDREIGPGPEQVGGGRRHEQIEGEVHVGLGHAHLAGDVGRGLADAEVRDDRPALLAEARLVEAGDVLAVEQRRGSEDLVHRHDPGAADPHEEQARRAPDAKLRLRKSLIDEVALPESRARAGRRHHRRNDGQSPRRHE